MLAGYRPRHDLSGCSLSPRSPLLPLPESLGFAFLLAGVRVVHGGQVLQHGRDTGPPVGEHAGLLPVLLG
jgi:hypothetical protein